FGRLPRVDRGGRHHPTSSDGNLFALRPSMLAPVVSDQQRGQRFGDPPFTRRKALDGQGVRRGVPAAPAWLSRLGIVADISGPTRHRSALRLRCVGGTRLCRFGGVKAMEYLKKIQERTGVKSRDRG